MRVLNREGTPFNSGYSAFAPTFAPVKDKFVERYIPLLQKNEKREQLQQLAQRSRKYMLSLKLHADKDQGKFNQSKKSLPTKIKAPALPKSGADTLGENIWPAMEKLMMRDGRVYSLAKVLQKVKTLNQGDYNKIHDGEAVQKYFNMI